MYIQFPRSDRRGLCAGKMSGPSCDPAVHSVRLTQAGHNGDCETNTQCTITIRNLWYGPTFTNMD